MADTKQGEADYIDQTRLERTSMWKATRSWHSRNARTLLMLVISRNGRHGSFRRANRVSLARGISALHLRWNPTLTRSECQTQQVSIVSGTQVTAAGLETACT
jgi:hypothetical protein